MPLLEFQDRFWRLLINLKWRYALVPKYVILCLIDESAVPIGRAFRPLLLGGVLSQETGSADLVIVFRSERVVVHHVFQIFFLLFYSFYSDPALLRVWGLDHVDSIVLDIDVSLIVLILVTEVKLRWRARHRHHVVEVVRILHLGEVVLLQAALRPSVILGNSVLILKLWSDVQA